MAKQQALLTLTYPVYTMDEAQRLLTAGKVLDLTSEEMIRTALSEFLDKRDL